MITLIPGKLTTINNSAIRYGSVAGVGPVTTTENTIFSIIPTSGVVKNFNFKMSAAPGSGKSYTFGVRINGSTVGSVTISDTNVDGQLSGPFTVTAGDTINYITTPTSTPVANPNIFTCFEFIGDDSTESIVLGTSSTTQPTTVTRYYPIWGYSTPSLTEASGRNLLPTPGTFKKFYWQLSADPGTAPDAYQAILTKNGSDTSLTSTIVADNITGNDTSNSFTISAGDTIALKIVPTSTPTVSPRIGWGLVFIPDTLGESIIMSHTGNALDAAATEYNQLGGSTGTYSTTEATFQVLFNISTIKKWYVKLITAPASGKSYTFTIRDDSSDTSLVATISDTATDANSGATTYDVTDLSLMNLKVVPSGTPTTSANSTWGLVIIAPTPPTFNPSPMISMMAQAGGLM